MDSKAIKPVTKQIADLVSAAESLAQPDSGASLTTRIQISNALGQLTGALVEAKAFEYRETRAEALVQAPSKSG